MKQKMLQIVCDRCGKTHNCAFTKKGETDGGYTTFDCYEPVPEDWGQKYIDKHYDLCPDCLRIVNEKIDAIISEMNTAEIKETL